MEELTFKSILAEALVLIFSIRHAVTTVEAGPTVTGAVVHTLANGFALCEAVGQIHFLVVDGDLQKRVNDCIKNTKFGLRTFFAY